MPHILSYLSGSRYDADTTRLMGEAFDTACGSVPNGSDPLLREVLAKSMLAQAEHGERDPARLIEGALATFGLKAGREG